MMKKTLLQAIGWRLEQGQQVFFEIRVFEGKKGGRPEGRRPGRRLTPRLESVAPKKQVANLPGHFALHRGDNVGIDIQGHFHGSMAIMLRVLPRPALPTH